MHHMRQSSISLAIAIGLLFVADMETPGQNPFSPAGRKFVYSFLMGECEIEFSLKGTYIADYQSEGVYWHDMGTYSIVGSEVRLQPTSCLSHEGGQTVDCATTLGPALCTPVTDNKSIYYSRYLRCNSDTNRNVLGYAGSEISFPIPEFKVPAGEKRVFAGHQVITMGGTKGVSTVDVKIRKGPSIAAEALEYQNTIYLDPNYKPRPFVPAGTEVLLLARTAEKVAVQKWKNYWYLVSVGAMSEVWVFGEFIRKQ